MFESGSDADHVDEHWRGRFLHIKSRSMDDGKCRYIPRPKEPRAQVEKVARQAGHGIHDLDRLVRYTLFSRLVPLDLRPRRSML